MFKRVMLVAMATASLMIQNTLYCVITQINVDSDQIFVQFSLFMIDLNSSWGCQLAPGHHTSIRHCATCTYMYSKQIYISKSDCNVACIGSFGNFNAGLGHNLSVLISVPSCSSAC